MTNCKVNSARRRHLRAVVLRRDGAKCFYCRTFAGDLADLTMDHLVPQCQGGPWTPANLVMACHPCNQAKADRPPQEFLHPFGFLPGLRPRRGERARRVVVVTARAAVLTSLLLTSVIVQVGR